jgi:hypothetical protein
VEPRLHRLLLVFAIATVVFVPGAVAAPFTDVAKLPRDATITVEHPVSANVDVHERFASISSICFDFVFQDDLLDPGDTLSIFFKKGFTGGFGFRNVGTTPQAERTICLVADHDEFLARFFDGKEQLILTMDSGSVTVASLRVTIDGVPL